MLALRLMAESDLSTVEAWLRQPHVARWWTPNTTAEAETEKYRRRIAAEEPTTMLMIVEDARPIGWCQWYRWSDYSDEAEASGAEPGEVGIDYAIGMGSATGRGLGSRVIALIVDEVRRTYGPVGILVAPQAENRASRRVLEKNGFELVAVRPVATEPTDAPMAIYRSRPEAASAPASPDSPDDAAKPVVGPPPHR